MSLTFHNALDRIIKFSRDFVKSYLCFSVVRKGHNDDLFDLYLSRDLEVCRGSS